MRVGCCEGRLQWLHGQHSHADPLRCMTDGDSGMRAGDILPPLYRGCPMTTGPPIKFSGCQHVQRSARTALYSRTNDRPDLGREDGLLVAHHQSRSRIDLRTNTALPAGPLGRLRGRDNSVAANPLRSQTNRPTQTVADLPTEAGVLAFMYDFRLPFDTILVETR